MKKMHLLIGLIAALWMSAAGSAQAQYYGRPAVVRGAIYRDCAPRYERVFVGYTRFGEPIWRTVRVGYRPPVCAPVVVRHRHVVCSPRARYAPARVCAPVRHHVHRGGRSRR